MLTQIARYFKFIRKRKGKVGVDAEFGIQTTLRILMLKKPNKSLRILIYDHDRFESKKSYQWLKLSGQNVSVCDNYDTFLDILEAETFDVVLFDLNQTEHEQYDSFHAIKSYRVMYGQLVKTVFILYTNQPYSFYLNEIEAARVTGVIKKEKTKLPNQLFYELTSMLGLTEKTAKDWVSTYNEKSNISSNIIPFRL